jgi:hypothetical protein
LNKTAETFRVEYENGDSFLLKPIFDIHYGSKHCDVLALRQFLGKPDPKTLFIGGGDLLDSIITSDLKRYRKSSDGSNPEADEIIDDQIDGLYKILAPYKSQFLGLGQGNHEDTIVKHCGTNPTKRLAEKLETKYLGYSYLARLVFSHEGGQGRTVVIRGHHGWGGGSRTQGADLTKYSKDIGYWDADLFLYGHVHKINYDQIDRLSLKGDTLVSRPKFLCICGTFLRTYSETTDPTYSEIKGYPPVSLGGIEISIRPNYKWVEIEIARRVVT